VLPAVGTNRRVTVFGSVEALGRGRVEVVCEGQNSACFLRYLEVLDRRRRETGREVILVLDNGSCHKSKKSRAALAEREGWLHPIWLARYSPHLNLKEREWRYLKRDARSHLAETLRGFVDDILAGLSHLVHLQSRFRVVGYSNSHETSNLRTYAFQGRAQRAPSRTALQRHFHLAPIPDASGQFEGR